MFTESGPHPHKVEAEPWGNSEEFKQCDGNTAGSDGYGIVVWGINNTIYATTSNASGIRATSSTLNGNFNSEEAKTEYWFGYGPSSSQGAGGYPYKTAVQSASAAQVSASSAVSGLTPNTKYYARLFARNADGEVEEGNEIQYSTLPPSVTTSVAHPVNGQPGSLGSIWVSGTVQSGASPIPSAWVNVNFQKLEGGQWVQKEELSQHPIVTNGSFSTNSEPRFVGKGTWKVRAVILASEGFGESVSPYSEFVIGDGYQLINRNSGKCLDVKDKDKSNGASLQQYDCYDPTVFQNQVFSLVQVGSSWQLVARHSNRCVDVENASASDGAWLHQWQCLGAGQTNQLWEWESMGGGYSRFKAKHSGKCADVFNSGTQNGATVVQWGCTMGLNQQWSVKSVEAGPMKPDVTFHVDSVLHGQPGYVTVSGKVNAAAYPIQPQSVNIVFEKEVSAGNWQQLENVNNYGMDGEGNFKLWYHGVAPGNWRARAVFNSSSPLLASNSSPNEGFEVKRGYRLRNRYTNPNKCLSLSENKYNNGQAILQWDCAGNPQPGDGQVLTFVPVDFGYFELKFNGSNKCVDVSGVNYNNGAWLQAWDCLGASQTNQVWQKVELANQPGWYGLIAKHSGRCADVTGPSAANGVRIQQWDCLWTANQQWSLEGIN